MIGQDSIIRLSPGVQLHVQDDMSGFVESCHGVRKVEGTGLQLLAEEVLPRLDRPVRSGDLVVALESLLSSTQLLDLLEGLHQQGVIECTPEEPQRCAAWTVAVFGPRHITSDLMTVLGRMPLAEVRYLGEAGEAGDSDADLTIAATASIFDRWVAMLNESCVRAGRAIFSYGVMQDGIAFVGPLWTPDRLGACYECLRTRIFANSVNGPTWHSYTRFLARAGLSAMQQQAPPWMATRLAGAVGRDAAGWLARPDEDRSEDLLWLDEAGDETRRRLLPVPTCRVCAHRQRRPAAPEKAALDTFAARSASAPTGPATAPDGPTAAVDDRVGIVHSVHVRRAESGPQIYLAGSTSSDLSLIRPGLGVIRNGGAGFVKKDALHATVGESLERYAAGLFRPEGLRLSSWNELASAGEAATPPEAFGLFSAEQYASSGFPFTPFRHDTQVRWVRATCWLDGSACWVPASQVYLYYRLAKGEAPIAPSISTGLAAGPSYIEAVLSGLCEVLERDALAISWLHRLPPRPVAEEVIAASAQVSYHLRHARLWRVRFYDLSLEFTPPVVVAVMDHRSGSEPVLSFGSACRMSPVRAVEKAFLEAAQGLTYVRRLLKAYKDFQAAPDFGNVDEFNKHAILYTRHPELRQRAGYLVHPDEPPACTRPPRPLRPSAQPAGAPIDTIAGELAAHGFQVYVMDLTTPDTQRAGVRVVRVLVPGLQHLAGVHRYRLLGNPRLQAVVQALGIYSEPDNPYPHPLP
jgi:bacteriocin biosynthesis cyclodehydratase domain-containing protein